MPSLGTIPHFAARECDALAMKALEVLERGGFFTVSLSPGHHTVRPSAIAVFSADAVSVKHWPNSIVRLGLKVAPPAWLGNQTPFFVALRPGTLERVGFEEAVCSAALDFYCWFLSRSGQAPAPWYIPKERLSASAQAKLAAWQAVAVPLRQSFRQHEAVLVSIVDSYERRQQEIRERRPGRIRRPRSYRERMANLVRV